MKHRLKKLSFILILIPLGVIIRFVDQKVTEEGFLSTNSISDHYLFVTGLVMIVVGLLVLGTPSYILAATLSKALLSTKIFSGLGAAIFCLTLVCIPYAQLIISAAFTRISSVEEEAAICLGATPLQVFNVAIWPQIRAAVAFSFLISFLYSILFGFFIFAIFFP